MSLRIVDAVKEGDLGRARQLIEEGSAETKKALDDALFQAIVKGSLEMVQLLVSEGGCDANQAKDEQGNSPLRCACVFGHMDVVEYLAGLDGALEATVKKLDDEGFPPHMTAAWYDRYDISNYLMTTFNLDVNQQYGDYQVAPMHVAAWRDSQNTIEFLCEQGADVNVLNREKRTPALLAACAGNIEIIQLLKQRRADLDIADTDGDTPLLKVLKTAPGPKMALLQCLLDLGADLHVSNNKGDNALSIGAVYPRRAKANRLSALDAEISNGGNNQPEEVVRFLMAKDAHTLEQQGERALIAASQVKRRNVVRILVEGLARQDTSWWDVEAEGQKAKKARTEPESWDWHDRVCESDDDYDDDSGGEGDDSMEE